MRTVVMKQPSSPLRATSSLAHGRLHRKSSAGDAGWQSVARPNDASSLDFSQVPVRDVQATGIRTKLDVSATGDMHEQEADRVAEQVMRMPPSTRQHPCACGVCQTRGAASLGPDHQLVRGERRTSAPSSATSTVPPIVHDTLRSPGQALDPAVRVYMEPRFGHDFSRVRIHADGQSAHAARTIQARAYTLGNDVVLGEGEYRPATASGKRLLAHELVHVVQQSGGNGTSINRSPVVDLPHVRRLDTSPADNTCAPRKRPPTADGMNTRRGVSATGFGAATPFIGAAPFAVARKALDVAAIDRTITGAASAGPDPAGAQKSVGPQLLGHLQGEIAFAANYPGGTAPKSEPAKPLPKADRMPVPIDTGIPIGAHYFPSGRLKSRERALILGGFHGDERPGWEVVESLVSDLSAAPAQGARPLFFHTIIVPRVNAGAIADELGGRHYWRNRCNRQVVDLNRNFPTGGTPKDTDCANTVGAPTQPEVQGVIGLIKSFRPDRILSTHAISSPGEAGVFADPNTDPAAIALARGMASTLVDASNRPFNRLSATTFNPVYPKDSPGKVSGGTSLGSFGPTATGGNTPVITMEAPKFGSLDATGKRSKEAFLRPAHAFMEDPAVLDALPDEQILADIDAFTAAERVGLLTGRLSLANKIFERIRLRVDTAVAKLNSLSPPEKIGIVSGLRLFADAVPGPTGSAQSTLVYNKFFLRGHPDTESFPTVFFVGSDRTKGVDRGKWLAAPSATRLAVILKFSALPGASRHHWGTDVDFNSTSSADWAPATAGGKKVGRLFDLGVWLSSNAARAGFVQAYTAGRPSGYNVEPWHFSYAPIAKGLRARYDAQVNLSTDVADAFLTEMKKRAKADGIAVPADLDAAVKALKISDFVDTIGPGL